MVSARADTELTGLVFDIQRFTLDDGPGIRTTVFLKGCPLQCRWCQNPESISAAPQIGFRAARCIGCRRCADACERNAILPGAEQRIDPNQCDTCGACVEVCPSRALFAVGRQYAVAELVTEVERDAAFYEQSGGGVTLSGGEPFEQFEFVQAFLRVCKDRGLHTAIETNGFTTPDRLEALLPYLDRIYFDLKVIDDDEHRRLMGVGNAPILANARRLVAIDAPVIFRVPVVPGMTATDENVRALSNFLHELGVSEVELCPYRNDWLRKLNWLRPSPIPALDIPSLTDEETLAVGKTFARLGIATRAHGNILVTPADALVHTTQADRLAIAGT